MHSIGPFNIKSSKVIVTNSLNASSCFLTIRDFAFQVHLGQASVNKLFQWSDEPSHVVWQDYYLIGLLKASGMAEVRSIKTGRILQRLSLPGCTSLIHGPLIYGAGTKHVWRILPLDFEDQIDELVALNGFSDAIEFINELDFPTESDKASNITKVKAMQAQYMFSDEKKYKQAIELLESLNASPVDIIELYPAFRDSADADSDSAGTSLLNEHDHDIEALEALLDYLSRERAQLTKLCNSLMAAKNHKLPFQTPPVSGRSSQIIRASSSIMGVSNTPTTSPSMKIAQSSDSLSSLNYNDIVGLCQVVDSTLLKIYVILGSPLLGSLVRLENFCQVDTSANILKAHGKHHELLDFYRTKQCHDLALAFLEEECAAQEQREQQHDEASLMDYKKEKVEYICHLKFEESADIIFKYAKRILEEDEALGFTLFEEHYNLVPSKYRCQIHKFLQSSFKDPTLSIKYLEYVVFELKERTESLHNILAFHYLDVCRNEPTESK